jgi:penicillin-binding protein 2
MLAHVIGYVGMISQKEYGELSEKGYNIESVIGKSGIEKIYDYELKGKDGYIRRIVDATNQVTAEIVDSGAEPVPGNNVILTIDRDLQQIAEEVFGDYMGALIVTKPRSGEILALVSSPRFDPNFFVSGRDREAFKQLTLDPGKPFLNRSIQAQYPAGSIFKLVVSLAILDTELVPFDKEYVCGGGYQLGNRFFSCWTNHGSRINLRKAIVHSCDSYFYQTSLVLGPDIIAEYARNLGLGRKQEIDLIGELEGIIPVIQCKRDVKRRDVKRDVWYDGDTLNFSIGQGFMLVTPLQLNSLTCIIANRGILMRPHIVKEIRSARNDELIYKEAPEMLIESSIIPEHFEFVMEGMRGVVTEGTARWGGAVLSAEAAGKTSSSEVQGMVTHSWYTAFAPFHEENSENIIAVTAIVEFGGAGSVAAAPIVSEVIETYFSGADLDTVRRNIWKQRVAQSRKTNSGGDDSGTDSGGDSSTDSSTDSGGDSSTDSGGDSGTDSGGDRGDDSGGDSGTDSGGDRGGDSSTDSGTDSGTDKGGDSGTDSSGESSADSGTDSSTDQ